MTTAKCDRTLKLRMWYYKMSVFVALSDFENILAMKISSIAFCVKLSWA